MKKLLSILLALVLVTALAVPVLAADNKYQGNDTSPLTQASDPDSKAENNTEPKFSKYFITASGSTVPTVTFTYTITAGTAVTYQEATPEKWTYGGHDYPNLTAAQTAVDADNLVTYHDATNKWLYNSAEYDTEAEAKAESYTLINHVAAGLSTFEVLAPKDSGTGKNISAMPTFKTGKDKASFSSTSTVYTALQTDDTVHLDPKEQYCKAVMELDFSNVKFYEPGVYRFVITEVKPANPDLSGLLYDTQEILSAGVDTDSDGVKDDLPSPSAPVEGSCKRYLDVYVVDSDDGNANLKVQSYVLHEGTDTDAPLSGANHGTNDSSPLSTKSEGFVNEYETVDIDIAKEVSGNQGSRDKYFKFTLTVPGAVSGHKYIISIKDDDDTDDVSTHDGNCDPQAGTNAATTVSGNNYDSVVNETLGLYQVDGSKLNSGFNFYLQHGQHIVFRGLPASSTYTVTEDAEDYKSEAGAAVIGTQDYKNLTSGNLAAQDAKSDSDGTTTVDKDDLVRTSFKNTRDGVIPTGVAMGFGGAALLLALAVVYFVLRKRMNKNEE